MRRHLTFDCQGAMIAATLDEASEEQADGEEAYGTTGVLIVSGGNEVRSGAHRGQAFLAAALAQENIPVFRFDRRGIGDSQGDNHGFESSADDIAAAIRAFRSEAGVDRLILFGNCDAATALALHIKPQAGDTFILSNPWVIEQDDTIAHSPQQLRQRYWSKLRNPRALWQFLNSDLDVKKLSAGLKTAAKPTASTALPPLADAMRDKLIAFDGAVHFFIASGDRTAQIFAESLKSPAYAPLRQSERCHVHICDTNGHSYAGATEQQWLIDKIVEIARRLKD